MSSPYVSVFEMFTIGIGPSSSHTVGPMRAARHFAKQLSQHTAIDRLCATLYGSLADTGMGHGTDKAVILGLLGHRPEDIELHAIDGFLDRVFTQQKLALPDGRQVTFSPTRDIVFSFGNPLPKHPNGMHLCALDAQQNYLFEAIYYSVGGGFILREGEEEHIHDTRPIPFPFQSAQELLELCSTHQRSIAQIMLANESALRDRERVCQYLDRLWETMFSCMERGIQAQGFLPGPLHIARRAHSHYLSIEAAEDKNDPLTILDRVNLYALAVNEENAAGGRVVTAPTNGAAGIIPAVLRYAIEYKPSPHPNGMHVFLLTAAAIGSLYKQNASLSGADVGCQGEVGVACSMAAGALCAYVGGNPSQVECAAEIGMEHNLGLTCDPIGGLVQIPCIERNAMGAVKAINASRLALAMRHTHHVSLDKVMKTMLQTGRDMQDKYKETARGGLAVNVIAC